MAFMRNERAFTGLEAAIVLIAFVVVAAVFSYVVLGAGFFTTQQSQETVHTGVQQASSSVELVGNVYGMGDTTNNNLTWIQFTLGNTAGGTAMDISKAVMVYVREGYTADLSYNATYLDNTTAPVAGEWGVYDVLNSDGTVDELIEPGEQYVIEVHPGDTGMTVNKEFSLSLQPASGAVLRIGRTVPAAIDSTMILY